MKRFLLLTMTCLLFSNCHKEPARITFMIGGAPAEIDFWEEVINKFTDSTGIKVTIVRQPADTDERRQTLLIPLQSGEKDPDVFLMDIVWIGQFAASKWLEPIDEYIEADGFDLSPFFERVLDIADRYNHKLVALPVYVDAGLLYYRKDLLEKYQRDVPQTWQQLAEVAVEIQRQERITNPNFWGFLWQGAQYEGLVCNFLEYASSNRGGLIKNGILSIASDQNIVALSFMKDLIWNYQISPPNTYTEMKEEEVRTLFESGNALFERNWPYAWMLHQSDQSQVRGKVGVSILPKFENGDHSATLGGWHIGISSHSDQKQAAWRFVKYVVSDDLQMQFALRLGWNPSRRDAYSDTSLLESLPHLVALREAFDTAVARPILPYYTLFSKALQKHLNAALSGIEQPDQALAAAQREAVEIVGQYGY